MSIVVRTYFDKVGFRTDEYEKGFVHWGDNTVSINDTESGTVTYPLRNVVKVIEPERAF